MISARIAGLALATACMAGAEAAAQGTVKVGDKPSYTFQNALVNGQGIKSLGDLKGRPVLVEFWGTH